MDDQQPQRLARTTIYENPWVTLHVDRVRLPGGRIVEAHHVLHFAKEAVASLVEDAEERILLVEAYRDGVGSVQWELPAGGIDPGETAIEAAAREVREESGYTTTGHELAATFEPINGIGDKVHHLVCCRAAGTPGAFDTNEVRAVRWVSQPEIEEMLRCGQIRDGYTLTGLLWWLWRRAGSARPESSA